MKHKEFRIEKVIRPEHSSKELSHDQILSYLASGHRKPQNEKEEAWLASIEKTRKSGKGIELAFD